MPPRIADMRFAITRLADFPKIAAMPGGADVSEDLLTSIFEEGGKFAGGVLTLFNRIRDQQGSRLENGIVRPPDGWATTYGAFVEAGCAF